MMQRPSGCKSEEEGHRNGGNASTLGPVLTQRWTSSADGHQAQMPSSGCSTPYHSCSGVQAQPYTNRPEAQAFQDTCHQCPTVQQ